MVNDLISDGLTRIRNAAMRRMDTTELMYSKTVESVLAILKDKGYIENVTVKENGNKKSLSVVLKYDDKGHTVINEVKRVSTPGRRVYKGAKDIKRFKNGYGTIVLSTSSGVMDNNKAHELGVGGEVLCTIW